MLAGVNNWCMHMFCFLFFESQFSEYVMKRTYMILRVRGTYNIISSLYDCLDVFF